MSFPAPLAVGVPRLARAQRSRGGRRDFEATCASLRNLPALLSPVWQKDLDQCARAGGFVFPESVPGASTLALCARPGDTEFF